MTDSDEANTLNQRTAVASSWESEGSAKFTARSTHYVVSTWRSSSCRSRSSRQDGYAKRLFEAEHHTLKQLQHPSIIEATTAASTASTVPTIGRKNWLFVGNDDGARANAVYTSLLAICRMLGVEPWSYLRDILGLIPRWPTHRLLELGPAALE